ncbi:N-acetyl sugar amidotransferase [Aliarcobacter butzleri]|uniref:N-acetyl sugar amidotransferase n=1 Tax=Aliarcobacter butzleri TaxID=28197 RepID=UPI00125F01BE|nr:N-acetyl sugar amidotransferase [Aliarcobacter butzleri]MDK2064385.1 N-acetyl sugar amidotransferase [Aliarcobacter butzleri]
MKEKDYQICANCIMDTTDPEIYFDENGVCNHCLKFENQLKKNWFPNEEGKKKLDAIINQIKIDGKNKKYDCVIGLSGGVDSSYLAYILRKLYPELRILAIHIDGGWNSELAVHNIENIVKILGIDLYTGVVPWEEMQDLQLAFFKSQLANQDVPQDHAFFATLYYVANKNGIKYFLSGGNLSTESILPSSWGYNASDGKLLKSVHKKFGKIKLKKYKTFSFFKRKIYYPYFKKFRIITPLDFLPYFKDEAKETIKNELNWRDYGGKHHESKFTKFFQAHWLPTKFGFDKRKAHLSSLIVSGQMTRDEALKELEKPLYDETELKEDKEFISKKLGISLEEFEIIMKQSNKTFLDYASDYKKSIFFSNFKKKIKKLI